MFKCYLPALLLLISLATFAQDTTWTTIKVNKDMTFSLPSNQEKTDTSRIKDLTRVDLRVFRAYTANTTFVLTVTSKEMGINVSNPESLKIALDAAELGMKKSKSLSAYNTISSDTVIDKITARKLTFYTGQDAHDTRLSGYIFILNDNMYFLVASLVGPDEEAYKAESNRLVRSVHFTATEIKEQEFSSKQEATGYKIGYLFGKLVGCLSIIAVIIVVIVLIARRSSKKKEF